MRLKPEEQTIILNTIGVKDKNAKTYLFGSRVDDKAKGGDIDLLILSHRITLLDKLDVLAALHHQLGNRKIDIVVQRDASQPFAQLAIQSGVCL